MRKVCFTVLGVGVLLSILLVPGVVRAEEPASLEEMIGQMVLVGFRGMQAPETIVEDIKAGRVGGVILFDYDVALKKRVRNIKSPDQVKALVQSLKTAAAQRPPLFVAIDQEGGKVARLKPQFGFPATPSAQALGGKSCENTLVVGKKVGKMLAALGINFDFAPVVDVNVNPENPVIGKLERSFSGDPDQVAKHAFAFIEGLHAYGVLSSLKHFPGHGSGWNDSHHGLADVTETWTEKELVPYEYLINKGACDVVMTAHIFNGKLDADVPATLSKKVITGLLRERLGFEGVVVSDDMQMKAISSFYGLEEVVEKVVNAGVDILLFGNNLEYDPGLPKKIQSMLVRMVKDGRVSMERVQQSYDRIMALKARLQ